MIFSSSLIRFSDVLDRDLNWVISVSRGNTTARSMSALSFALRMSSSRLSFSWLKLRLWCDCEAGTTVDAGPLVLAVVVDGDRCCWCWCLWWWWCDVGVRWWSDAAMLVDDDAAEAAADAAAATTWRLYSLNVCFSWSFSFRNVFRSVCKVSFLF